MPSMREDASAVYRRYLSAVILNGQASADAAGLNATDFYAMNILALAGSLTSGQLAEQTGLTTGATTRLIDRLERAGQVRRGTDPADRRRVIVEPVTTVGAKNVIDAVTPTRQAVGEVFKRYNQKELAVLFDYFAHAAEAYQQATAQLRAGRPNT
jgi:DNA-binding MarR family transcriptional regulator